MEYFYKLKCFPTILEFSNGLMCLILEFSDRIYSIRGIIRDLHKQLLKPPQ